MRLKLPNQVSIPGVLIFGVVIFCVQQFEHTSLLFSELFFVFTLCSAISFNIARGFQSIPGSYVFSYAILVAILGVTWKAIIGEPADSNLLTPTITMGAQALGMAVFIPVAWLVMRFDVRPYSVANITRTAHPDYRLMSVGCLIVGLLFIYANSVLTGGSGSLISFLDHFAFFLPLCILLGTIDVIQRTDGERSVTWATVAAMIMSITTGFLAFSKEGMIAPLVSWVIAAAYSGLRIRPRHVVAFALGFAWTMFFSPIWAGVRDDVPDTGLSLYGRAVLSYEELSHFSELRAQEAETAAFYRSIGLTGYFQTDQGFMDRLQMLGPDDSLVAFSSTGHYEGVSVLLLSFQAWLPHFLVPNKIPVPNGNTYSHEMGTISPDDTTTGISFSAAGEAFHLGGWSAIALALPGVWLLAFFSATFVVGDMVRYPWGLLMILYFAHAAPESGITGPLDFTWNFNISVAGCIFFCNRIAPIIGALLDRRSASIPAPSFRPLAVPTSRAL